MPRLLLVEKDRFMQRMLQKLFAAEGYFCTVAADGDEIRRALEGEPFDLVVLDLGPLQAEGLNILRRIRADHHTPVLILAPRHDVVDTVAGLEGGADDYLCEPFDARELIARVRHTVSAAPADPPGCDPAGRGPPGCLPRRRRAEPDGARV
jgi:DNA-binding response OmpR family regulator